MSVEKIRATFVDGYGDDEDVRTLLAEIDRLTAERDAYKKAKAENDERFMAERDAARAEVERLRARMLKLAEDWEGPGDPIPSDFFAGCETARASCAGALRDAIDETRGEQ